MLPGSGQQPVSCLLNRCQPESLTPLLGPWLVTAVKSETLETGPQTWHQQPRGGNVGGGGAVKAFRLRGPCLSTIAEDAIEGAQPVVSSTQDKIFQRDPLLVGRQ